MSIPQPSPPHSSELCDLHSRSFRSEWDLAEGITYLNHGSFGPTPRAVAAVRDEWSRRLIANPMDFYLRTMEPALDDAASHLGELIGADAEDLVFVENATVGMNIVAESMPLGPGDEILLNDHEYGAVFRIWRRVCEQTHASIVSPTLDSFTAESDIVERLMAATTPRTKLLIISHVTSPTGIVFPVAAVCRAARQRGIPVCIDGPHAIAMRVVSMKKIECDFYCASLHKWLSAPFGSGFLFVRKRWQQKLKPHLVSWGRSLGGRPTRWQDDMNWLGTRDPAPFLAVPAAIQFLNRIGFDTFRSKTHELAKYARSQLESTLGRTALNPDSIDWYGSMVAVPLCDDWTGGTISCAPGTASDSMATSPPIRAKKKAAPNAIHPLQQWLWEQHRIESLITECHGRRFMRISCHLYNSREDIDRLTAALEKFKQDNAPRDRSSAS